MGKKLIINADDLGLSCEINDAVEALISAGKLRSVSILANSMYLDRTTRFLAERTDCSIGVHMNVVEGDSLSSPADVGTLMDKNGHFASLPQILTRWITSPARVARAVETEWRRQIEFLLDKGMKITHADSHQHIHVFPPFWRIAITLCREYGIAGLRSPSERNGIPARWGGTMALTGSVAIAKAISPANDVVTNDNFLGFKRAGGCGEPELIADLAILKDGLTELALHPSTCDGMPYPHMRGEAEYMAMLSEKIQEQIDESGIELTTWAEVISERTD